ncbi:MAG: dynamin family protein [Acidobacteriota bacterium]|jgi:small GTP-binding protein
MIDHILEENERRLVADERETLAALRVALTELEAAREDLESLDRSIAQLDELFLLVVVGEFNAGKSAFINALLGRRLLEVGVTPTTAGVHLIRHGPQTDDHPARRTFEEITAPVELLREVNVVDTPGTNAIQREHEALTRDFIPRSDLVLFVTSADRPFTESERSFLETIRDWGKKVVVVVNKIDILETPEDVDRVVAFVTEGARELLGREPEVFPVSARQALDAKLPPRESENGTGAENEGEPPAGLREASRFGPLETYVTELLDEGERLRLKLLNPLGVGLRLEQRYRETVEGRLELLSEDVSAIEDIERQLEVYRQDMEREFRYRLADVENILHEFQARGDAFFEETLRIGRVFDLLNKARMKRDFERRVVGDLPDEIEDRVADLIDWLVAAELRQWQTVTRHVTRRRERHADRIVGEVGDSFDYDRDRLLATVGQTARRTVESYDREQEGDRMAESVQLAVASAALLEAGAIGLGATVALVTASAAVDVTGILAASALALIGLFVIPSRRRTAKRELSERIETMRVALLTGLTGQFEREMDRSLFQLRDAIAPYTRFVRAERSSLDGARERLEELRRRLEEVKGRIEGGELGIRN